MGLRRSPRGASPSRGKQGHGLAPAVWHSPAGVALVGGQLREGTAREPEPSAAPPQQLSLGGTAPTAPLGPPLPSSS